MKYKNWIIVLVVIGIALGVGAYFIVYNVGNKNNEQGNYEATRTEANANNTENNIEEENNKEKKDEEKKEQQNEEEQQIQQQEQQAQPVETEIASYTTKIVTKDSGRQKNIQITCNTLNGTIVEPGETFSFCGTVGKATSEKGYEKADIFDANGKKIKGLGGGNCQISSTLYNAVLSIPTLKVTERHAHSNKVPYIESGKDAAVAYGSCDLKFQNNTGYKIKILASTNGSEVTTKIISLT